MLSKPLSQNKPAYTNNEINSKNITKTIRDFQLSLWGNTSIFLSAPQTLIKIYFACWLYRILGNKRLHTVWVWDVGQHPKRRIHPWYFIKCTHTHTFVVIFSGQILTDQVENTKKYLFLATSKTNIGQTARLHKIIIDKKTKK